LKLPADDGNLREADCVNTEGLLRIIQSIPSPKAEPLKRSLAKVGSEWLRDIEDPERICRRTREISKAKGLKNENLLGRMTGLAQDFSMLAGHSIVVAPRAGAWIETPGPPYWSAMQACRPPARVRSNSPLPTFAFGPADVNVPV
jgi:hypothetical protein